MTKKFISKNIFPCQLRIQTGKFYLTIWLLLKDKMALKMKNFNILGVHWKSWLLEGVHEGVVLLRGGEGWYPNAHYAGNLEWQISRVVNIAIDKYPCI